MFRKPYLTILPTAFLAFWCVLGARRQDLFRHRGGIEQEKI
jgi:hypothetical protein